MVVICLSVSLISFGIGIVLKNGARRGILALLPQIKQGPPPGGPLTLFVQRHEDHGRPKILRYLGSWVISSTPGRRHSRRPDPSPGASGRCPGP
jgi:hypothetical protein